VLPIFLLGVAAFGILISYPFEALVAVSGVYLVTIPVGAAQYRRRAKSEVVAAEPTSPVHSADSPTPGGTKLDTP